MPTIKESSVTKLTPTQITVRWVEVTDKIKGALRLTPDERIEFMRAHAAPVLTAREAPKVVFGDPVCRAF
jgi:hypothetical protein